MSLNSRWAKRQREGWRVSTDQLSAEAHDGFDEVVVGKWFHMERMDTDAWWMQVGDLVIDMTVAKGGKVSLRFRDERMAEAYRAARKEGGLVD